MKLGWYKIDMFHIIYIQILDRLILEQFMKELGAVSISNNLPDLSIQSCQLFHKI